MLLLNFDINYMYLKLPKIRRRRKTFITPCKAQLGVKGQTLSLRNSVGVHAYHGFHFVSPAVMHIQDLRSCF